MRTPTNADGTPARRATATPIAQAPALGARPVAAAPPRGQRAPTPTRRAAAFAFALALGALAGCTESPTDPADLHDMVAEITGERDKQFRGDAEVGLENGFFYIRGEGTGIFEGQNIELIASSEGEPEVGTYTIGPRTGEDGPDFRATWRMAIALFTATEGTLTITLSTDEAIEGEFSFTAERTHVCNSLGSCQSLDGDLEEGEIEGSFRAERDPPDEEGGEPAPGA